MIVTNENVSWRRLLATNSTVASYPAAPAPADVLAASAPDGTTDTDSTLGYVQVGRGMIAGECPSRIKLKFYGVGADNTTGNCRVYGVSGIRTATGVISYTHTLLVDYAFTLSLAVGVAAGAVVATERYADTIVRTTGNANISDQIVSPTGDVAAHAVVDVQGFKLLFIQPILGGGSPATSTNVLYSWY